MVIYPVNLKCQNCLELHQANSNQCWYYLAFSCPDQQIRIGDAITHRLSNTSCALMMFERLHIVYDIPSLEEVFQAARRMNSRRYC